MPRSVLRLLAEFEAYGRTYRPWWLADLQLRSGVIAGVGQGKTSTRRPLDIWKQRCKLLTVSEGTVRGVVAADG
jgi:hypothetical protein